MVKRLICWLFRRHRWKPMGYYLARRERQAWVCERCGRRDG